MGQHGLGNPGLIEFSTYPTTHFNEIGDWYWSPGWTGRWGYGILWWAWDAPKYPGDIMTGPYQGAFSAIGANGQFITVFPLNDIVVAHKVNIDIDESRAVSGPTYMTISTWSSTQSAVIVPTRAANKGEVQIVHWAAC